METLNTVWDFLKRHTLIIMIALCGLLYWQNRKTAYQNDVLSSKIVADNTKFDTWRDSMGRENARQRLEAVYINQLSAEAKQRLEDEARLIGVAINKISNLTQVSSTTTGSLQAKLDSLNRFNYKDSFLTVKGSVDTNLGLIKADYIYKDVATITTYDSAKKFLGITYRRDHFMNVRFGNPNTNITGLSNISLRAYDRPKHFVVGPQAGVTYVGGVRPFIGVGVTYKLFEF